MFKVEEYFEEPVNAKFIIPNEKFRAIILGSYKGEYVGILVSLTKDNNLQTTDICWYKDIGETSVVGWLTREESEIIKTNNPVFDISKYDIRVEGL